MKRLRAALVVFGTLAVVGLGYAGSATAGETKVHAEPIVDEAGKFLGSYYCEGPCNTNQLCCS